MAEPTVLTESVGGVLTVTLNRPAALNAFSTEMHRELADALRQAERDAATRVIVLTGAGRAFCAGQDLKALGELPAPGQPAGLASVLRATYNPLILRLR